MIILKKKEEFCEKMPFGRKERVTMLEGIFERRRNRFVAEVWLHGALVVCHVKNTGRCKELLLPGAKVWLELSEKEGRKTAYDLILVEKEGRLINIDSSAPNRTAREYLKQLSCQDEFVMVHRTELHLVQQRSLSKD